MQPPVDPGDAVVSFIVPARNEEANLPPLFERLLAIEAHLGRPCEIVLVDDSSSDDTLAVAEAAAREQPRIRPLHRDPPPGIGRAIRTGIEAAGGRVGVVVMADGVDPLEEAVPGFCAKVLDEGCQLVLLSRYTNPDDARTIPLSYRFFQGVFRFATGRLLGIPYPDTTYAFRAFDLAWMRSLGLRSRGFEISPETTFRTFYAGGRIGEVAGRQSRRVRGKSKFRFSRVAAGYSRVLAEGLLMRLGLLRPPAEAVAALRGAERSP